MSNCRGSLITAAPMPTAPLSHNQRALWFLQQLRPDDTAYHLAAAIQWVGDWPQSKMTAVVSDILQKQQALRTQIVTGDDGPLQKLLPVPQPPFDVVDVGHLSKGAIRDLLSQMAVHPFPENKSLFRMRVLKQAATRHILFFSVHHLVADYESLLLFVQRLLQETGHLASGCNTNLHTPFYDFIHEMNQWVDSPRGRRAWVFWQRKLSEPSLPDPLALPLDSNRPQILAGDGDAVAFEISTAQTSALQRFAGTQKVSLATTLLAAYRAWLFRVTGQADIVVATPVTNRAKRAYRHTMGYLINPVPVREALTETMTFQQWACRLRDALRSMYRHGRYPFQHLVAGLQADRDASRPPLAQTMFTLLPERDWPGSGRVALRQDGTIYSSDTLNLASVAFSYSGTPFELSLMLAQTSTALVGSLEFNIHLFHRESIEAFAKQFCTLLMAITDNPGLPIWQLGLITEDDQRQLLAAWNREPNHTFCQPLSAILDQVEKQGDRMALCCGERQVTYRCLWELAQGIAGQLRSRGIGDTQIVGLCLPRDERVPAAMLACWIIGAAYLPLDMEHPRERLQAMANIADLVVTGPDQGDMFAGPSFGLTLSPPSRDDAFSFDQDFDQAAYMIYTSGSTGRPKAVVLNHGQVAAFFQAMTSYLPTPNQTWLALTEATFDIAVLELLWPLTQGHKIVIQATKQGALFDHTMDLSTASGVPSFSLFYFADDENAQTDDKYHLLLAGAAFADKHGFEAVWTPERHFHAFGGLYPNPSLAAAAIAARTRRIAIRAGSVVLPLHHPIRVAEEWSFVDNLSGGRVGISIAPGWQPNDFVLNPDNFVEAKQVMFEHLEQIQTLWRGETLTLPNGRHQATPVQLHPRPQQANLPVWLTAAGNPATFREAGKRGLNILTHLLGQSVTDLAEKLAIYRQARQEAGHPGQGHVTLMLHTFLGSDETAVRATVKRPFQAYLRSSLGLMRPLARDMGLDMDAPEFDEKALQTLLDVAFERYAKTATLFGTPASCAGLVAAVAGAGVNEIGCLIDFGVPVSQALQGLESLNELKNSINRRNSRQGSVAQNLCRQGITHLQATPSTYRLLLADAKTAGAMAGLPVCLVGGEALNDDLSRALHERVGSLHNMYGPTETTIWSSATRLAQAAPISLGRALANNRLYVLDAHGQLAPTGVWGELFIGGAAVSPGYYQRPGLTASRFGPDPYTSQPGARMYRTGDRARWNQAGQLLFGGRLDFQIKLRGHRIEPGEVEQRVQMLDQVAEAAVVVRGEQADLQLWAFVVPRDKALTQVDVQTAVSNHLPRVMVPSRVVIMSTLPLTSSGKINRPFLRAWQPSSPAIQATSPTATTVEQSSHAAVANVSSSQPQSLWEQRLAALWRELLGVNEVARTDSFFALGGHSLLLTKAHRHLVENWGVQLDMVEWFKYPTLAGLAARLSMLTDRNQSETLAHKPNHEPVLTHAQERLWFLEQLQGPSNTYLMRELLQMQGPLSALDLEQAVRELLASHEGLRTAFINQDGKPAAHRLKTIAFDFQVIDMAAISMAAMEMAAMETSATATHVLNIIHDLNQRENQLPFDLTRPPLWRMRLLRLSNQEHWFLFSKHHLISDGWSMGVMARELSTRYTARLQRRSVDVTLPIQMSDAARWQRQQVTKTALETWQERLRTVPHVLDLPTDYPRPEDPSQRGDRIPFSIGDALGGSVSNLAKAVDGTPFMVYLTALAMTAARYANQDQFCIGTPVANRQRPELEPLIGFLANVLALTMDLRHQPTGRSLLRSVREVAVFGFTHGNVPFEMVVDAVQPQRYLNRHPLFQLMFVFEKEPPEVLRLPGIGMKRHDAALAVTKFDLTVLVTQIDGAPSGVIEFDTDLFTAETAQRFAAHFRHTLHALTRQPDQSIQRLSSLEDGAQQQLLRFAESDDPPCYGDLVSVLMQHVQWRPDAIALVDGVHQFSYRYMAQLATTLAMLIQQRLPDGVAPVAVITGRTWVWAAAQWASLQAGRAFVCIAADTPLERLNTLLRDCHAGFIIHDGCLPAVVQQSMPTINARLVKPQAAIATTKERPPTNDLAYVLYTSGSTGQPKGVCISRQAFSNAIAANAARWPLSSASITYQLLTGSFDPALANLWCAWWTGARCVLAPEGLFDAEAVLQHMVAEQVTATFSVPSQLQGLALADQINDYNRLASLRQVTTGGASLDLDPLRAWLDHQPQTQLVNAYGPTETTIISTFDAIQLRKPVTIGRPLAGNEIFVCDRHLLLSPQGVPGELVIGGLGLAQGYLRQAAVTAAFFVPHPFGGRGARLYRTGDRVRWNPAGKLLFLGRFDEQIKLRGFRIEPGEIAAVLRGHEKVGEACVIFESQKLIAYAAKTKADVNSAELRDYLARRLPHYMLPTHIQILGELPRLASGKVDRRNLPKSKLSVQSTGTEPNSPAEILLCRIWAELLHRDRVGVDENFFGLGGDSILAIQVVARARQAGWTVTAKQIFSHQTVAALATQAKPLSSQVSLRVEGDVPLSPLQAQLLQNNPPAAAAHFNQAIRLRMSIGTDADALQRALDHMVAHHDSLRLRYEKTSTGWTQSYGTAGRVPLHILAKADEAAIQTLLDQLHRSFDFAQPPLLQALLIKTRDEDQLVLIAHHLVIDGVSWRILSEDLLACYTAFTAQQAPCQLLRSHSFQAWVKQLQTDLHEPAAAAEKRYWQDWATRADSYTWLTLPTIESNCHGTVQHLVQTLPAELTHALSHEAHRAYNTRVDDLLLASLAASLAQFTGAEHMRIDVETHGREALWSDLDISRTLGWFTTLFPLHLTDIAADTPEKLLPKVKDSYRSVPNRGLFFRPLCLWGDRSCDSLRSIPASPVLFNYLGQLRADAQAGWQLSTLPTGPDRSPALGRHHSLEIDAAIIDGCLTLTWVFQPDALPASAIAKLQHHFATQLEQMIAVGGASAGPGLTPSDVPLANIEQRALTQLVADRPMVDLYPLTPMQAGILFQALLQPEAGDYISQMTFTMTGAMDHQVFRDAWDRLFARHAILRTSFHWDEKGLALQAVLRHVPLPYRELDWRHQDAEQQSAQLQHLLAEDRAQGYDLEQAPLMRIVLIRLADAKYQLVWSHHHLLLDGWSAPRLLREILAQLAGESLPSSPVPFRQFVAALAQQDKTAAQRFWRENLADFEPPTKLTQALSSDCSQVIQGLEQPLHKRSAASLQLSPTTFGQVQQFLQQERITLTALLQGVWSLLLSRYNGSNDVCFGLTLSGRTLPVAGIGSMVGMCINTVPARIQVENGASAAAWLRALLAGHAVREQHGILSLAEIQRHAGLPAETGLFESLLVVENYPLDKALQDSKPAGLTIGTVETVEQIEIPLTLVAVPLDGLRISLNYKRDQCNEIKVNTLMHQFHTVFQTILNGVERLAEIDLTTAAERRRQLAAWNPDNPSDPGCVAVCEHIVSMAQRLPDHVVLIESTDAVAGGSEREATQLSYRYLLKRAQQLGGDLLAAGLIPEQPVVVHGRRCADMVIAELAVLLAGGAYLPLANDTPPARVQQIFQDAGALCILGDAAVADRLANLPVWSVSRRNPFKEPTGTLRRVKGEQLAYIIYTSGSTGTPKGVAVQHRSMARMLTPIKQAPFDQINTILQLTGIGFDVSVFETWQPIYNGGRTVLLGDGEHSSDAIARAVARYDIDTALLTTSLFNYLIDEKSPALARMSRLLTGGEAISLPHILRAQDLYPQAQLFHGYGPTENTIITTIHAITPALTAAATQINADTLPFGRSQHGDTCLVLDQHLRMVPGSGLGQLFVAGAGNARCYVGNPRATALAFLPNPYGQEQGERMYRTGDLVRQQADGQLMFAGRADHQVKLRGFRIETGEIANVLKQQPDIDDAAVVVRDQDGQAPYLAAYVVARTGRGEPYQAGSYHAEPTWLAGLWRKLKVTLPEYMVPSCLLIMEQLPKTGLGKLDRRALPKPMLAEATRHYTAPRNPLEQQLALLFREVLDKDRVGIHHSFFDLGGHSLMATQLVSRIRRDFELDLPLARLFENPSIAGLAELIEAMRWAQAGSQTTHTVETDDEEEGEI